MDAKTVLENGKVRGNEQSKVLSSSFETDPDTTHPLSMKPSGCEVDTQNHMHEVQSVVQPSDTNKNDAPQSSIETDQISRELWPFNGPGSTENRNVAIENHNVAFF